MKKKNHMSVGFLAGIHYYPVIDDQELFYYRVQEL